MSRYFLPFVFALATFWVWNTNTGASAGGTRVVVPFVDVIFPEAAGKPDMLGERSVWLMAGATGALLLLAGFDHVRASLRQPE